MKQLIIRHSLAGVLTVILVVVMVKFINAIVYAASIEPQKDMSEYGSGYRTKQTVFLLQDEPRPKIEMADEDEPVKTNTSKLTWPNAAYFDLELQNTIIYYSVINNKDADLVAALTEYVFCNQKDNRFKLVTPQIDAYKVSYGKVNKTWSAKDKTWTISYSPLASANPDAVIVNLAASGYYWGLLSNKEKTQIYEWSQYYKNDREANQ